MENGKQYVYMNHFTLGRETAACEKKTHPLFHDISLYLILTMSFYFSIFQLQIIT